MRLSLRTTPLPFSLRGFRRDEKTGRVLVPLAADANAHFESYPVAGQFRGPLLEVREARSAIALGDTDDRAVLQLDGSSRVTSIVPEIRGRVTASQSQTAA